MDILALLILELHLFFLKLLFERQGTPVHVLLPISIALAVSIETAAAMIEGVKAIAEPYTRGLELLVSPAPF